MTSTNETSSADIPIYHNPEWHWQINNAEPREGTNIREWPTEFPYDQTEKALKANGTEEPIKEEQIERIEVELQLMKDNVKATVFRWVKLWFIVKMFPENSPDEIYSEMVEDAKQNFSDPSIYCVRTKAPFHAPEPGYYRIEISTAIYNLRIGADPKPPGVKGEFRIKVNSEK